MFPQNGNGSHVTCTSSRRRILFQSHVPIAENQLKSYDASELLQIVSTLNEELAYTKLENTWIIAYLQVHQKTLLDGILGTNGPNKFHSRRIQFDERKQLTMSPAGMVISNSASMRGGENEYLVRDTRLSSSLDVLGSATASHTTLPSYMGSSSQMSNSETVNIFMVSLAYKCELCNREAKLIATDKRELAHSAALLHRRLAAEAEDMRLANEEAKQLRTQFRAYLGTLNEKDVLAQRERCNRLRKFINTWIGKGERQVQQLQLKLIAIERQMSLRVKSIASKQILRGRLMTVEFTEIQIDVATLKHNLRHREQSIRALRNENSRTVTEKINSQAAVAKATVRIELLARQIGKIEADTVMYDASAEVHTEEVETWTQRVADAELRHRYTKWPSVDEYMEAKRQLAGLDREMATLRRVERLAQIELRVTQSKVRAKRGAKEAQTKRTDSAHKNWLRVVAV